MTTKSTPQVRATQATLNSLTNLLRKEAEAENAQWPQYKGHWDGWRVVEVTRRIRTKLGPAFEPGDLVLSKPGTTSERVAPRGRVLPYEQWPQVEFVTCYSRRNRIDTAVRTTDIREVLVVADGEQASQ